MQGIIIETDKGDIQVQCQDINWIHNWSGPESGKLKRAYLTGSGQTPYLVFDTIQHEIQLGSTFREFLDFYTPSVTVYIGSPFDTYYRGVNGIYYSTEDGAPYEGVYVVWDEQLFLLKQEADSHFIGTQGDFYILSAGPEGQVYQLSQLNLTDPEFEMRHRKLIRPRSLDPFELEPEVTFPIIREKINQLEDNPIGDYFSY